MPAANKIIPLMRPQLPKADRLMPYLRRIDSARIYSNHGPLSVEFGQRLAKHFGLGKGAAVCASSGTVAIVGSILATAGRAQRKRPLAVVPALTFAATAAAAEQCGYEIFLMDIDSDSWMLDAQAVGELRVLERVGVVIPVAPFGRPVPLAPWRAFREKTGIPVVIDGAASFQGVSNAPEIFLGEIPVSLSFHATKCFATGEGGCVITTDDECAKRVTQALNFGIFGVRDSTSPGTNGKMSEYHAAVGLAEFDGWTEKQRAWRYVAEIYRQQLTKINLAHRLVATPEIGLNYILFFCNDSTQTNYIQKSLHRHGVSFLNWYGGGLRHQSYYSNCAHARLTVTEKIAPNLIGLPTAPDMAMRAVMCVAVAIQEGVTRSLESRNVRTAKQSKAKQYSGKGPVRFSRVSDKCRPQS